MLRHRVDLSDVAARTRSTLVMLMWLFYAFYFGGGKFIVRYWVNLCDVGV